MSADNGTASVPASPGFIFSLLVRVAGIIVGIATLLRLATNEKLVTYDPLFLEWMDRLSDIVELGFLTKLIGPYLHQGIDWVRSFGISVPDLQDEWRPAFVLSMLMLGAFARHSRSWGWLVFAPVGALILAVWSGLVGSVEPVGVGAAVGFTHLFLGIVDSWGGGLRVLFANRFFNIGIDILGVMLGALGLASLFANPPIW